MQAMADELERSIKTLQMENLAKPYFIAYRVDEIREAESSATFGSMLGSEESHRRYLTVELRVGDYAFDNTNFVTMPSFSFTLRPYGRPELPLEDSYQELRREIWLATDTAYKQALEHLAKKQAALQNKTRSDEIDDFSRAEPFAAVTEEAPPALPDISQADGMMRKLSQLFCTMPDIYSSTVRLGTHIVYTRYVNSEGTRYTQARQAASLVATATTQAVDGMLLNDFVAAHAGSPAELPDEEKLAAQIRAMGERLAALRSAPLPETYNGPVLFEGQAAAELLAQALVPKLLASPEMVSDNPMMGSFLAMAGSSLIDKLGARVLPRLMQVVDDPTLQEHSQQPLLGGYPVDDEGVPAGKTVLVERGLLKTLLTSRTPVRGIASSTGNSRAGGTTPSNLVFSGSGGLTDDELHQELIELVKERELEFGVIVRRIANPIHLESNGRGRGSGDDGVQPVIAAYRLYPDGREELVRNLTISELETSAFKDIVAVSGTQTVTTIPFSSPSQLLSMLSMDGPPVGGPPLISLVTPSLLFEDMTLKKPTGEIPKPPFAIHPSFQ
jgi:predicted Zn-dependent protease